MKEGSKKIVIVVLILFLLLLGVFVSLILLDTPKKDHRDKIQFEVVNEYNTNIRQDIDYNTYLEIHEGSGSRTPRCERNCIRITPGVVGPAVPPTNNYAPVPPGPIHAPPTYAPIEPNPHAH